MSDKTSRDRAARVAASDSANIPRASAPAVPIVLGAKVGAIVAGEVHTRRTHGRKLPVFATVSGWASVPESAAAGL